MKPPERERSESRGLGSLRRSLDPAERLGEALFGLIMVLTFTLTAGFAVGDGPEATRELLVATVGCNVAWAVIDGAMFLMARLLERNRSQRALRALHTADDERAALAVVDDAVEEAIGGDVTAAATAEERRRLLELIRDMALRVPLSPPRLGRDDLLGAAASASLVMLETVPAALPFLFVDAPARASSLEPASPRDAVPDRSPMGEARLDQSLARGMAFLGVGMALVGTAITLGG